MAVVATNGAAITIAMEDGTGVAVLAVVVATTIATTTAETMAIGTAIMVAIINTETTTEEKTLRRPTTRHPPTPISTWRNGPG